MEEAESFMLRHGENIVDTLGGEVDRIEKNLKVRVRGRSCVFNTLHSLARSNFTSLVNFSCI